MGAMEQALREQAVEICAACGPSVTIDDQTYCCARCADDANERGTGRLLMPLLAIGLVGLGAWLACRERG